MSGALYESIFVVEMSSRGAEILCLIVPEEEKECFVVRDRFGISGVLPLPPLDLLVVKALERDISTKMVAKITYGPDKMGKGALLPSTNEMVGCWPLTVDGGVRLSELMISADKLGRCTFSLAGLAGREECAQSCECPLRYC